MAQTSYGTITITDTTDLEWFYGTILDGTGDATDHQITLTTDLVTGAAVGSMYLNTQTSLVYKCVAASDTSQTWQYVGNMASGVQVGGKNMLTGTNVVTTLASTGTWADKTWREAGSGTGTITSINITDAPDKSIAVGWNFAVTSVSSQNYGSSVAIGQNGVKLVPNKQYTISCYAKGTGKLYMFYGISSFAPTDNSGKIDVSSEWEKYSITFTTPASNTNIVSSTGANVFFGASGNDITLQICGMKLEEGNVATAWSPAPEDTQTAINEVQENLNASRSWYAECPTAAATAAKVATITPATTDFTLITGTTVAVKFTYTNTVASPTLNVNGTGAIAIMRYGTTAPSTSAKTSWQANSINTLTYDGTYWRLNNWLNDDTTYNLGRNLHATAIKVLETVASGCLMAGTASGYKKIAAGLQFSLSYPLLYASAVYTANTTYSNTYETWNSVTYTTTAAIQSGAANKTIYLKGMVSANTFTIDSTNVFTTVEPTSADGCFYIPLGIMSSATVGNFSPSSSLYAFIDGRFRQVTPTEIVVSQRIYYRSYASGTVPKPTAWITKKVDQYNANVSVGNDGWSTKITPIADGLNATSANRYLYLYTCEQRKRLDGTVECTDVLLDDSTTVIDGGKIITGSVTANQIAANAVTAEKIHAEAVTLGKLGSDVTDSINDAGKTASNFIVADETGLMIAELTNNTENYTSSTIPTGNRNVFIDSDSLDIRDGQNVLASFGENTIIGAKGDSRIELSSDSIFGYHKDHGEFFKFSGNGYSTVVESHSQTIFNGLSQNIPYGTEEEGWSFTLAHVPVTDRPFYLDIRPQPIEDFDPCDQYGVITAGTMVWKWEIDPLSANGQTFGSVIRTWTKKRSTQQVLDFIIEFMYNPNTGEIFNIKASNQITAEKIPGLSFSAYYKTLESASTFSLGEQNNITGAYSIGIGLGLESAYANQLIIGKYNENYEHSLFEIGNGSDVLNKDTIFRIDAIQGLQLKSDADISGDKIVLGEVTDTTTKDIAMQNSVRKVNISLNANKNFGFYDATLSKWVLNVDANGNVGVPNGTFSAPKSIVHGAVTITPSAANTPTSKAVTWTAMAGVPHIALGAYTGVPGTQVTGVAFSNPSATGCSIVVTRTNTSGFTTHYIAIY